MKIIRLITIGFLMCGFVMAKGPEKKSLSEQMRNAIQTRAGIWGLFTIISSGYGLIHSKNLAMEIYNTFTQKHAPDIFIQPGDYEYWRNNNIRWAIEHHLPHIVISFLVASICAQEMKDSLEADNKKSKKINEATAS